MTVKQAKLNGTNDKDVVLTVAANDKRMKLVIQNVEASDPAYIGFNTSAVGPTDYHIKLAASETFTLDNFYGKALSNKNTTRFVEFF